MKSRSIKTLAGVLAFVFAVLFLLGSCDMLLGPSDDPSNGDTNGVENGEGENGEGENGEGENGPGFTPGEDTPPLSIVGGTVGLSFLIMEFTDWNWYDEEAPDYEPLPDGVVIDIVETSDGETMTITFTGFAPDPDDETLELSGEVVLDGTYDESAGTLTLVMNGEIELTGHVFTDVVFLDASWTMPVVEGDDDDDGPFGVEVSGSIAFDAVKYQLADVLRAVQAAATVQNFVGETIVPFVFEFVTEEHASPWEPEDGVELTWEDLDAGEILVTFSLYAPDPDNDDFTIDGSVDVTLVGDIAGPLTMSFDGMVTIEEFVFGLVALNDVSVSWSGSPDGPPEDVTGSMTLDGTFTYQADYLTAIIMLLEEMFDD